MSNARRSAGRRNGRLRAEQLLERRVEERTRELTALLEVSRSLSSTLALEPLLDLILDQLLRVIDYRSAGIFLARDEVLETVAMRDAADPARDRSQVGYRTPITQRLPVWQAVLAGEPVVIGDVRLDDNAFARAWRTPGTEEPDPMQSPVRAWMAVPLSARGQVFGILALTRDVPDSFTAHDTELALAFAGHAAVAIGNAGLLAESEERTREVTALLDVSRTFASTIELDLLLGLVLDQLKLLVDYTSATTITREGGRYLMRDYRGPLPREDVLSRTLPTDAVNDLIALVPQGTTLIIPDVWADTPAAVAYRATGSAEYLRSAPSFVGCLLNAPLIYKGHLIGLLTLGHRTPGHFTEHHAMLTQAVADQAAAVIENARLYERERRTAQELAALLAVARGAASTLELEPLLSVILDTLKPVVDYAGASIGVVDGDEFRFLEARGASAAERRPEMIGVRLPMRDRSDLWDPLFRHQPVIIADVRDDSIAARAFRRTAGEYLDSRAMRDVRSFMAIPLVNRDRLAGLLTMSSRERGVFTERHAGLVMATATHIAAALENARLYDQTEQRARELATLLEVSRRLSSTIELKPLTELVLDQLKTVADYTSSSILVRDGDELVQLSYRWPGIPASLVPEQRIPLATIAPIWESVSRRGPMIVADVRGDSPAAGVYRGVAGKRLQTDLSFLRSWMAVPITLRDRVVGMITLGMDTPDFYTPRHAGLATAIASQAAIAIDNARLLDESERRARELATLLNVSHAVASTLDLSPLLELILEQLKTVVDYRGATLGTIEGDELLIVASRAVTPERESDRGLRFPLRRFGPIWETISRGEPAIVADVHGDDLAAVEYRALNATLMAGPTHRDIRSWMAVPLALGDRVIGMLSASQDVPNYFTAHHAELALAFANQVTVAIENARLFAETQGKAALEERQRLARELHDSVSQALFGIALGAGAARRRLDLDPARVAESLDYVLSLADVALTEMRSLIFELRPEALEKDGLVAALTRHAAATRARHEVTVETVFCEEPNVPLATKEALYRIAQEAMHNAVKHARASRIDLILASTPGNVFVEVRDDGVGFDVNRDFAGHLGLHSMRERMAVIGGTTDITSAPGQGTSVRATALAP